MADNTKLKTFIQRLRMSEQFAAQKAMEAIEKNADEIELLNKKQMSRGVGADEQRLGDYSEMRTVQRVAAGKQVGFIDLKFEGEFHESVEARGQMMGKKAAIFIEAHDPKWVSDISQDARFENALGLTGENRDKMGFLIATYIRNELVKYYKV